MCDQQTNRQHHDKGDREQNENHSEYNNSMGAEPKSITNIYYDCLERIFDLLDLKSLLNVACTCKRLQIAAAAKFSDDFGNKEIQLNALKLVRYHPAIYHNPDGGLEVCGINFCLPFLRCFGVQKISIEYNKLHTPSVKQYDHLERYISEYCADQLTSITFYHKRTFSAANFVKPFKNAKILELYHCNLGDQFPTFVNLFPNLYKLKISSLGPHTKNDLAGFLPHLEHLFISLCGYEDASKLLHGSQRLQSLEICISYGIALKKILDMISENKSILKLTLSGTYTDVKATQIKRFVKEHSLMEELHINDSFTVDQAITLVRQLKSLKRFEYFYRDQINCERFVKRLDTKWKYEIESFGKRRSIKINRSL